MYVVIFWYVCLQQDGIYVNERFLHTFASCIVSSILGYVFCYFRVWIDWLELMFGDH